MSALLWANAGRHWRAIIPVPDYHTLHIKHQADVCCEGCVLKKVGGRDAMSKMTMVSGSKMTGAFQAVQEDHKSGRMLAVLGCLISCETALAVKLLVRRQAEQTTLHYVND